jgi:DNA helicase-4
VDQRPVTLEALRAAVERGRLNSWRPGTWGARLTTDSDWSASVTDESLQVNRQIHAIQGVRAVRLSRGLIWARILVEHEDGRKTRLGGLTNDAASSFVDSLTAACVLSAAARLSSLFQDAERQRDLWIRFTEQPRWIAQSEVKRFVRECPANKEGSDLSAFMARGFTRSAMNYLEPERASLLAFLDGRALLEKASARNERFLDQELERRRTFFDRVEKNPLTDEQCRAVITLDDNVMAVAAAGSGKTSVMVAKAGYAVSAGLFRPEHILLLAFNRSAAAELAERVRDRLTPLIAGADRITVATFHSLGLAVIGEATGTKPILAPWVERGEDLAELSNILKELGTDPVFILKWILFRTVFARSLPAFGAKEEPEWWDPETGRRGFLTLRGETVKSQEERMICDWLAGQGINYEYERPYEHDTATSARRQYMPDFYYPSAGVYHEHFALDEQGNPPAAFAGYADGVRWKRALHAQRGTTLIETTSHGIRSPGGFGELEAKLRFHGVKFGETPLTAAQMERVPDEASLLRVFRTFLSHAKCNRLTMEDLRTRAVSKPSAHPYRDQLFLDIFEYLSRGWERHLAAAHAVDFDDMLGQAADHLAAGRCAMPYRLVMADEFQDTSRARGALLRELTKAEDARLFVVGDDWQAVNRFAGADISLMKNFGTYFGDNTVVKLTQTFRCPSDLCDIASTFIMANPFQIEKTVVSTNKRKPPNLVCFRLEDIDSQDALLRKHLGTLAQKLRASSVATRVSVYVLGRNHFNQPVNLPEIRDQIADVIDLKFSTVHAAKGLEADYVFLMNVIEATYGLPSKVEDDSTLWIAMPEGEDFPFAEERRLFYVALTRAKRMVTMYTDAHRRSEFIAELQQQGSAMEVRTDGEVAPELRSCPQCETGVLIVKKGKYREFLGCSRFPRCDYTTHTH